MMTALITRLAPVIFAQPLRPGLAVANYPNPFDSRIEHTTIIFAGGSSSVANVKIYDYFGNLVKQFCGIQAKAGTNTIVWDGAGETGEKVAKGGYIAVVEISNEGGILFATRKIGVIH